MTKFFIPFSLLLALFGCNSIPATQKPQITTPQLSKRPVMMCTMQYDPVCVKTMNQGVAKYQTYSNACMASNSVNPISITKGACGTDATK